jgi:transcription termination factor Rho
MKLSELKAKNPQELMGFAESLGLENLSRANKQGLIFFYP